jgi:hypothetical protein
MVQLIEQLNYDNANIQVESIEDSISKTKSMCMKGIFLQAETKNHNDRIYPRHEIAKAVDNINERIKLNGPLPGECAHPEGLEINIDRISHAITNMWMENNNGMGKLKILPTQHGNIIKVLLENSVKLGVSSRGSGSVGPDGKVYDFDIITIDIVSQPSAPEAYPQTIYEQVLHAKNSHEILKLADAVNHDYAAQKYFKTEVLSWFDNQLWKK